MTKELEQQLIERWPSWFYAAGDLRHTLLPLGFVHGDGWFRIIWRLCDDLKPLVAEAEKESGKPFEVLQVKEIWYPLPMTSTRPEIAVSSSNQRPFLSAT
jgi:hypothetical protein